MLPNSNKITKSVKYNSQVGKLSKPYVGKPISVLAGLTAITLSLGGAMLTAETAQAATGHTESSSRYLSGSLLGTNLDNVAGIEGVSATVGANAANPVVNSDNLNLGVLGNTISVNVPGGVQVPLNFTNAGVVGQYAQASPTGSSQAISGLVDGNGTVGTNPNPASPPGDLTLDLSDLLGEGLSNFTLSTGVDTASATEDATGKATGDYNIAGVRANLTSPAVAGLSSDIRDTVAPLQASVNGIVGPNGTLITSLSALNGAGVTTASTATVNLDLNSTVNQVLAENQVLGGEGPVTVNLGNGVITVDIAELMRAHGMDINSLPPNSELLTPQLLGFVTAEVNELVNGLLDNVQTAVQTALDTATLNLNLRVGAVIAPATSLLGVTVNAPISAILDGTAPVAVTVAGAAAPAALTAVVNTTLRAQLTNLTALRLNLAPVTGTVTALNGPLTDALTNVVSLRVNNQSTVNGRFTETALHVGLLNFNDADGNLLGLNLAQATVGPNDVAADPTNPAAPTITGFTPVQGPEAGGTVVTITGTGFTGVTGVTFGDTPATNVTVVSDTQIRATSPAGTGAVNLTVGGTTSDGVFTYIPSAGNNTPTITGFTPVQGPEAGGTVVTITGTNFTGVTGVDFGGTPATDVTVVSDTQIRATSPAGTGSVHLTVGDAVSDGVFTYIPDNAGNTPVIAGFTPVQGPEAGGTVVTITGSNFTGVTDVAFDGVPATNVTVVSDTQIRATSPAGTGSVHISVGDTVSDGLFTYIPDNAGNAPVITGFTPVQGPETGGTVVTITGTNFTGTTGVTFGDNPATNVTVVSDTQIVATSPVGTGAVPITVTTPAGDVTSDGNFTYVPVQQTTETVISGFTPTSGPEAGGTVVTISGVGFTGVGSVSFGNTPATNVTVVSDTEIVATSPAGTGAVPITVFGPNEGTTSDGNFTYIPTDTNPGTPGTITGFTPTSGPEAGGTVVTITGTGFTGATGVQFGNNDATTYIVTSDTQIIATTPAGTGAVKVTIDTVGGDAVSDGNFTYVPTPANPDTTILGFTPVQGPEAGGTIVTIIGTGFTGIDTVLFGNTPATNVTVVSDNEIIATSPAGTGPVNITVGDTVSDGVFTYVPANPNPGTTTIIGFTPTSGPENGGNTVTIIGTGFTGVTDVTFGDNPGTNVTVVSDTEITVTAPPGTGNVPITVTGPNGDTTSDDDYTYVPTNPNPAAPAVTGFTPTSGPEAGGTVVTITGTGFAGTTGVLFGTTPATTFIVVSDTQIIATTPAGTGQVPVTVSGVTGTDTSDNAFTYIPAGNNSNPVISGFTPVQGPEAGGTKVVITGSGFTGATGVQFGGKKATDYTVVSDTQIVATTPAGTGAVTLTVNGANGDVTSDGVFTYIPGATNNTGTISGFTPKSGPEMGGTVVTIKGTGFTDATGVLFGTTPATNVTVVSDTEIIATAPAGTGKTTLTVVTPDGNIVSDGVYTYIPLIGNGGNGGLPGGNGGTGTGNGGLPGGNGGTGNGNGTGSNGNGSGSGTNVSGAGTGGATQTGNLAYTGSNGLEYAALALLLLASGIALKVARRKFQ